MIETDSILVTCPRCGAWPMAARRPKSATTPTDVTFRCPKCHAVEEGRLIRAPEGHRGRAA